MGDDELGIVEDVMTDQAIEKAGHLSTEMVPQVCRQAFDLGERLLQPVVHDHITTPQVAHQLGLVIARDAQGATGVHHVTDQLVGVQDARPSVHQIAAEDGLPPSGMAVDPPIAPRAIERSFVPFVPKGFQQPLELIAAAMHVGDEVEGAVLVPMVTPQRLALDGRRRHLLG